MEKAHAAGSHPMKPCISSRESGKSQSNQKMTSCISQSGSAIKETFQ